MSSKIVCEANLLLSDKKVVVLNHGKSPNPSESIGESLHKTQWTAVQAAHQMASKKPFSCVMESLYNQVRTYFESQS
jgi:hypothetical protein